MEKLLQRYGTGKSTRDLVVFSVALKQEYESVKKSKSTCSMELDQTKKSLSLLKRACIEKNRNLADLTKKNEVGILLPCGDSYKSTIVCCLCLSIF